MRILLAEDERKVAEHIRTGLVAEGYAVDVAGDGDEALWLAEPNIWPTTTRWAPRKWNTSGSRARKPTADAAWAAAVATENINRTQTRSEVTNGR